MGADVMRRNTQIQAQDRFIERVNGCHPGHRRRVVAAARKELFKWFKQQGTDPTIIHKCVQDALDVANLHRMECE